MAKGLFNAIKEVQSMMRALPGVRPQSAPDFMPDKPGEFPFIVAYPGPGTWVDRSDGYMHGLVSIQVELHLKGENLQLELERSMDYIELIPRTILADPTLGETVSTYGEIMFSGLVRMNYGALSTMGYRWTVQDVKI